MNPLEILRRFVRNSNATVIGLDNQSKLLNDKLSALIQGMANQTGVLNDKMNALARESANQSRLLAAINDNLAKLAELQRAAQRSN